MIGQVFLIDGADFVHLSAVRAISGLKAARKDSNIWLTGIPMPEKCSAEINALPAVKRYFLDNESRLFPLGSKIPNAYLPKLEFEPISQFVALELPASAFAGQTKDTAEIRLQVSSEAEEADLMLCKLDDLKTWVESAPQIRIESLKFAVALGGNPDSFRDDAPSLVFIQGFPLPSIPGDTFWKTGPVYLPSGKSLMHPFLNTFLKEQCDPENTGTVIMTSDTNFELVKHSEFMEATRSGIRKTRG